MSSFRRRPPTPADADAVAELIAAADVAQQGFTDFGLADLEDEWRTFDLERDTVVLVEPDGALAAYGALERRGEVWIVDGYVHPRSQGRGAGRTLVTTLEAEAAGRGAHRVHNGVLAQDAAAHRLLESLGYRSVRRFWRMTIDLQEEPSQPEWPAHIVPEPFRLDAAEAFHAALEDGFADHWNHTPEPFEDFRRRKLENPALDLSLWRVVRSGREIVGGAICDADRYGGGWVDALFTRREWRRRGVGEALLLDAFGKFWARGTRRVGLGVDAQNPTGATRLYERVGMRVEWAAVIYEKEVGDGAA